LADWWEIWRGLSRFDLADATQDPDADGVTNLQECLAGTDPNDAASFLRMTGVQLNGADVFGLFTSVVGKRYNLERTDWLAPPAWNPVVSNIVGTGAFCRVRDPGGTSPSQRFYRVQVVLP
jgi:hypothetical protein